MTEEILIQLGMKDWSESRTPMRRMGVEEDLIGPIIFLASDASSYVNGEILHVDGGWAAGAGTHQIQPHVGNSWDPGGGEQPIIPETSG